MAMTSCRECGHRISTQATHCPACGAPQKRVKSGISLSGLIGAFFFLIGAFFFVVCCGGPLVSPLLNLAGEGVSNPPTEPTPIDLSQKTQQAAEVAAHAQPILKELDRALTNVDEPAITKLESSLHALLQDYQEHPQLAKLPEIAPLLTEWELRSIHIEAVRALLTARGCALAKAWLDAEKYFLEAAEMVTKLPSTYVNIGAANQIKSAAEREKKAIRSNIAAAKKEQEAQQALLVLCGTAPQVDPWDGGLIAVERFLKDNANDPSSVDAEQCSKPALTKKCWQTTCIVSGKNAFGATVRNRYTFYIKQVNGAVDGVVVGMEE